MPSASAGFRGSVPGASCAPCTCVSHPRASEPNQTTHLQKQARTYKCIKEERVHICLHTSWSKSRGSDMGVEEVPCAPPAEEFCKRAQPPMVFISFCAWASPRQRHGGMTTSWELSD